MAIIATMIYSFVVSMVILLAVKAVAGLRVSEEEEIAGVDTACHGEAGYTL